MRLVQENKCTLYLSYRVPYKTQLGIEEEDALLKGLPALACHTRQHPRQVLAGNELHHLPHLQRCERCLINEVQGLSKETS